MTHLSDFVQLLEYNFANSTFKAQKTLPLFPLVSPKVIKGSVSKVDQKSQGVGYISEFYKVFSNSRLTVFDSRYRTLDLITVNDYWKIERQIYSDGVPIITDVTDSSGFVVASNVILSFEFVNKKVRNMTFTSDNPCTFLWNGVGSPINIVNGTNTMDIPATGGIFYVYPNMQVFNTGEATVHLGHFILNDYELADPPFFVQIIEEKVLENSNFYETVFEVRYSL